MKTKLLAAVALAVLLILVFAVAAQATVSQATIDAIIADAADGHIDGDWTAAEIRAALAYIQNNPVGEGYSNRAGVLEDYLASLQAPGAQEGALAFTGGEVIVALAAGLGLIGGGLVLRRRLA
jgi:O-antigen ligase